MNGWAASRVAAAAAAELLWAPERRDGPMRVTIDSRTAGPGALFVGLPGARVDGGEHAAEALQAGAWGVLVAERHAARLGPLSASRNEPAGGAVPGTGAVLAAAEPLLALQQLATAWRRELGAQVIGVTGSTGKTTTKDILLAVLASHRRTHASRANFNTEIGLPLEILAAPLGTEVLVLEMGMRGPGQIAELARIAEPDVAVIVSIGPVHLELLGSLEAIAAAKAELIAGLPAGGTAILPAGETLLEPHLRADTKTVTFGPQGTVHELSSDGDELTVALDRGDQTTVVFPPRQAHLRRNLLAALAGAQAVGIHPGGAVEPDFAAGRGGRTEREDGLLVIDDSYNANPMSMRAALDDLAVTVAARDGARAVAVLGDMLELGSGAAEYHRQIGAQAAAQGLSELITVGPLADLIAEGFGPHGSHRTRDAAEAAELSARLTRPGDVVLVKASRGIGLEAVCRRLTRAH